MQWVVDWQLCDQSTGVGRVAKVMAGDSACFHNFCRHILTNPVEYLHVSLQNVIP